MEDLVNRGKSDCLIILYNVKADNSLSDEPVDVFMDGRQFMVQAGEEIRIKPGESITLFPYQYHTFWADSERILLGEVTIANNDHCFYEKLPSPNSIDEDEAPLYWLSNEYPKADL